MKLAAGSDVVVDLVLHLFDSVLNASSLHPSDELSLSSLEAISAVLAEAQTSVPQGVRGSGWPMAIPTGAGVELGWVKYGNDRL